MDSLIAIVISIATGIVSGIISGFIVANFFRKKDRKEKVINFWYTYLYDSLNKNGLHFPGTELEMLTTLGGSKSEFGKAIKNIDILLNPVENTELSEKQISLLENFKVAFTELNKLQ